MPVTDEWLVAIALWVDDIDIAFFAVAAWLSLIVSVPPHS
jgi:hypothetical protein